MFCDFSFMVASHHAARSLCYMRHSNNFSKWQPNCWHSIAKSHKLFGSTDRTFYITSQQKISHLVTYFHTQTWESDQDNWLYFLKYLFYEVYNFQIMSFSVTLQYELYPNMEHHCQYDQSLYRKKYNWDIMQYGNIIGKSRKELK